MASPSTNRPSVVRFVALVLTATSSLASFFSFERRAHAEAPHLSVSDDVTGCPAPGELRRVMVDHLGRDPFAGSGAPRVDVRVRRGEGQLYAEVIVERAGVPPRSRVITGEACDELVRAAALVASLAIEEDEAAAPPPAPAPPEPTPSPADRDRGVVTAPEPPRLQNARIVAVASGATSVGLLPRPASGAAFAARVRVAERVWLSARGEYLPYVAMPDDAFRLRMYAAGAGACAEPLGTTSVAAFGCGHVMLGGLEVERGPLPMLDAGTKTMVAAMASIGVRARVAGPVVVEAAFDAWLPFTRPTFLTAVCPASGFEQPFAALGLTLGAGVSIP